MLRKNNIYLRKESNVDVAKGKLVPKISLCKKCFIETTELDPTRITCP